MEGEKKRVIMCMANGSEEIETVAPIDMLRRCGVDVTVAKVFAKDDTDYTNLVASGHTKIKIVIFPKRK
jgi:putative intracellular protease/amidase